jgi:serine/threonine-protein kinase ATR
MAAQLCDLLGMSVDGFLNMTEIHIHILPYLVLMRKKDVIMRIARAAESQEKETSLFDFCGTGKNMVAIVSFLMIQLSQDPERLVISVLADLSDQFRGLKLRALLRSDPILFACELLKGLGDSAAGDEPKVLPNLEQKSGAGLG